MTTEEKQLYIERMKAKAFAYAENVTSDIKIFMPSDEYLECVKDFAQAFLCGGDAAWETIKEIGKEVDSDTTNREEQ